MQRTVIRPLIVARNRYHKRRQDQGPRYGFFYMLKMDPKHPGASLNYGFGDTDFYIGSFKVPGHSWCYGIGFHFSM